MKDRNDDGLIWGHIENGIFWAIPKGPMVSAGLGPPPFQVQLPDGRVRNIVHQPEDKA
jgi:hypothetical protein